MLSMETSPALPLDWGYLISLNLTEIDADESNRSHSQILGEA